MVRSNTTARRNSSPTRGPSAGASSSFAHSPTINGVSGKMVMRLSVRLADNFLALPSATVSDGTVARPSDGGIHMGNWKAISVPNPMDEAPCTGVRLPAYTNGRLAVTIPSPTSAKRVPENSCNETIDPPTVTMVLNSGTPLPPRS